MKTSIHQVLTESKSIAVVGASPRHHRESNKILRYLKKVGYSVTPINPMTDEVEGLKSYPNLLSVPDDITFDVINIFRRPEHVENIVKEALARSSKLGHPKPVIWTQLGVSSDEAMSLAEAESVDYIRNRCILVEHSMMPTS